MNLLAFFLRNRKKEDPFAGLNVVETVQKQQTDGRYHLGAKVAPILEAHPKVDKKLEQLVIHILEFFSQRTMGQKLPVYCRWEGLNRTYAYEEHALYGSSPTYVGSLNSTKVTLITNAGPAHFRVQSLLILALSEELYESDAHQPATHQWINVHNVGYAFDESTKGISLEELKQVLTNVANRAKVLKQARSVRPEWQEVLD